YAPAIPQRLRVALRREVLLLREVPAGARCRPSRAAAAPWSRPTSRAGTAASCRREGTGATCFGTAGSCVCRRDRRGEARRALSADERGADSASPSLLRRAKEPGARRQTQ